ncbi:MAG: oligosaccharide flippase family protein, partial [Verrucomicrobiota bacterium]
MNAPSKHGSGKKKWYIFGSLLIAGVVLLVLLGALLPIFITNWLGGKDFQRIASQQASSFLKTEGDFESFEWSSFSVYSAGFATRSGGKGEWNWDIRDIRTEISPRLLLDRILRFSEISVGSINMKSGTGLVSVPESLSAKPASSSSGSDLFRDVQVGKVVIKSFGLQPGPTTSGWGVENVGIEVHPNPQNTTFSIQGGKILSPLPWLGALSLQQAKGSYVSPQVYLTRIDLKSAQGGTLEISGEGRTDSTSGRKGRLTWDRWPLPEGKIGVGLFDIPAKMAGSFELSDWKSDGPVGTGQVKLIDARLEPGKGSETILGLLAIAMITRYLSPAGFGEYTTITTFLVFFAVIADLGLTLVTAQMLCDPKYEENKTLNNLFGLRLVSAIIFISLAPIIVLFFPYSLAIKFGVLICAAAFFFPALNQVIIGLFQKKLSMGRDVLSELVSR